MILQEQECLFLCVEGEVKEEGEAKALHRSCPLCVLPGSSVPGLSTLLTGTSGLCCPPVVVFSMAQLSLEVSYKPSISSSQT